MLLSRQLENILNKINIGIIELNNRSEIIHVSQKMASILNCSKSELLHKVPGLIFTKKNKIIMETFLANDGCDDSIIIHELKNSENPLILKITKTKKDDSTLLLIDDLTNDFKKNSELTKLAFYDSLTKIPNKNLFNDRSKILLSHAARNKEKFAIMYLDINNFKKINDTMGHLNGDNVLIELASRLSNAMRESDTVARIGGDEFVILAQNIKSKADATMLLERIIKSNAEAFSINGNEMTIKVSIGAAIYPDHGKNIEDLMNNADKAMYTCKKQKHDFALYEESS